MWIHSSATSNSHTLKLLLCVCVCVCLPREKDVRNYNFFCPLPSKKPLAIWLSHIQEAYTHVHLKRERERERELLLSTSSVIGLCMWVFVTCIVPLWSLKESAFPPSVFPSFLWEWIICSLPKCMTSYMHIPPAKVMSMVVVIACVCRIHSTGFMCTHRV